MFREIFGHGDPESPESSSQKLKEDLAKLEDKLWYKDAELVALKSLDLPWSTYLKRDAALREELDELRKKRADLLARIDSGESDSNSG